MHPDLQVSVNRDFARFGDKTYAINKINSVEVRKRRPYGAGAVALWGVLASLCLLFVRTDRLASTGTAYGLLFCGLFGLLASHAWRRSKIVEYQLFLTTSSREAQALVSRDRNMIDGLRHNIEEAIAGRLG